MRKLFLIIQQIEAALKSSDYVDNICIFSNSDLNCVVALVVPNPNAINKLADRILQSKNNIDLESACTNRNIIDEIHADIINVGASQGLKSLELPSRIMLCHESWTPDNNLLTAAMKLKRVNIFKKYSHDLDEMFSFLKMSPHKIRIKLNK